MEKAAGIESRCDDWCGSEGAADEGTYGVGFRETGGFEGSRTRGTARGCVLCRGTPWGTWGRSGRVIVD